MILVFVGAGGSAAVDPDSIQLLSSFSIVFPMILHGTLYFL